MGEDACLNESCFIVRTFEWNIEAYDRFFQLIIWWRQLGSVEVRASTVHVLASSVLDRSSACIDVDLCFKVRAFVSRALEPTS